MQYIDNVQAEQKYLHFSKKSIKEIQYMGMDRWWIQKVNT